MGSMPSMGETTANTNFTSFCPQNNTCTVSSAYPVQNIIYADTVHNKAHFRDYPAGASVNCSDSTFGDPSPTYGKSCFSRQRPTYTPDAYGNPMSNAGPWQICAADGGVCTVGTPTDVLYGSKGSYVSGFLPANTPLPCNSNVFGNVNVPNRSCYILPYVPVVTPMQSSYVPTPNPYSTPTSTTQYPSSGSTPYIYSSTPGTTPSITLYPPSESTPYIYNTQTPQSYQPPQQSVRQNNGTPPTSIFSVAVPGKDKFATFYGWQNIDLPGNNIPGPNGYITRAPGVPVQSSMGTPVPTASVPVTEEYCAQQCASTPDCNYYSYSPGNCYLKSVPKNNSNTSAKFFLGPTP